MDQTISAGPVAVPEISAPPAAGKSRGVRRRLTITIALGGALVVVLAVATFLVNSRLAQTYSPEQAVLDYFSAQRHGDANAMWSQATYPVAEGGYGSFFGRAAVSAMMQLKENRDVRDVRITSVRRVDSNDVVVGASLVANGTRRSEQFSVHKDTSHMHWLFYPSWRVEIPASTIQLVLDSQAGDIWVDGVPNPPGAGSNVQVIGGYHQVRMLDTHLCDGATQTVDARETVSVTFKCTPSQNALSLASAAVAAAQKDFPNRCDATSYMDCPGHVYLAPASPNIVALLAVPGTGDVVVLTRYVYNLTGDLSTGMNVTVGSDRDSVLVSGPCTTTLVVDDSHHYNLKGDFHGTLHWNGQGFDADLTLSCVSAKA
jgi:hypothetical protein